MLPVYQFRSLLSLRTYLLQGFIKGNSPYLLTFHSALVYNVCIISSLYILKRLGTPRMRGGVTKTIKETVRADAKSTVQKTASNLLRALQKGIKKYNVKGVVFTGYLQLT